MSIKLEYILPIGHCLALAERRISDAAHAFEVVLRVENPTDDLKRRARADMLLEEKEAREFYDEARKSGWDGDVDALIAAHWAVYLPQIPADMICQLRAKALAEAGGIA